MNEIKFSELESAIKNNAYNFYNIYNSDLTLPIYYAVEHYINNVEDTPDVDQKIHIIFSDIEVYWKDKDVKFDFEVSDHPINAITIYSTEKKTFKSFYLLYDFNYQLFGITPDCDIDKICNNQITKYKEWLLSEKYITAEENIEISIYNDEMQLLMDVWKYIRETNPLTISGFNSDNFDYPYIYRRMLKLWNNDKLTVDSIISQFKQVDFQQNGYLKIIDYPICDIQFLYKTRSDGGANLGKKLASYSLDFIADEELGLTKLEYKTKNIDIHEFYEKNPIDYLLYNIADVCLCVRLNEKLKHIELQNLIRRNMKLNFSQSLIGSSALYDAYILYELHKSNHKIRHGIVTEMGKEILPERLTKIPVPQTKNNKVKADKISKQEYMSIIYRYEGAYVKQSSAKIINTGVIMDLDASLPPFEKIFIQRDGLTFWNNIGDYNWEENDETLTWNNKNEVVWHKVLGKVSHPWTKSHGKILKFTTKSGKTVTVTDNHSIFCIQKGNRISVPYIIDAKNLKIGDYLVGFKQFDPGGTKTSHNAELLGFWLSDGWTASKNASYYIAKQDKSELDRFYPDIDNIRIKKQASDFYEEEWVGLIQEPVRSELKDFYVTTKRKSFIEILKYPLELRKLIWKGMYGADGTIHGSSTERLCKYRLEECLECFIVAHTIGWAPRLTPTGINNSQKYELDMVALEVVRAKAGYGTKLTNLNLSGNNRHPYYKLQEEMLWVNDCYNDNIGLETIIKIEEIKYEGDVYDISVEETERFFAGSGLGVHNTSLYPSMIRQYNIGLDTYRARIISPLTYKTLSILEEYIGKKQLPANLFMSIYNIVDKYVEKEGAANKTKAKNQLYYIISYHIYVLSEKGIPLNKLFNPSNDQESLMLKHYLIPLLDIIDMIHINHESYNEFVYDYIFDPINDLKSKYKSIYFINNANSPTQYIEKLEVPQLLEKINNLVITISGSCFAKHNDQLGLFVNFLTEMGRLRSQYRKLAAEFPRGSEQHAFYHSRQLAIKVLSNSAYGVLGLKSFRYSNNHLAQSITASGKLTIKLAQHLTDKYLMEFES